MEPLYCFKYEEDTGKITKIVIPEYTIDVNRFTDRKTYCFDEPKINKSDRHFTVPEAKLDRYVSNKVYTFNGDTQNAKIIILETLLAKRDKLYLEFKQTYTTVNRFLEANQEFDNEKEATI